MTRRHCEIGLNWSSNCTRGDGPGPLSRDCVEPLSGGLESLSRHFLVLLSRNGLEHMDRDFLKLFYGGCLEPFGATRSGVTLGCLADLLCNKLEALRDLPGRSTRGGDESSEMVAVGFCLRWLYTTLKCMVQR